MGPKNVDAEDPLYSYTFQIDGTKSKLEVLVTKQDSLLQLYLVTDLPNAALHWGVAPKSSAQWLLPPTAMWPAQTTAEKSAARTPFVADDQDGLFKLILDIKESEAPLGIPFVLFRVDKSSWIKNRGSNFFVRVKPPKQSPLKGIREKPRGETVELYSFSLEGEIGELDVYREQTENLYVLQMLTDAPNLLLHWGISFKGKHGWQLPPENIRPPGTRLFDSKACQTPFAALDHGISKLCVQIPCEGAPLSMSFVIKDEQNQRWIKRNNDDFNITIAHAVPRAPVIVNGIDPELAENIINAEVNYSSWTLMHRFNMCNGLLDDCRESQDKMAILFIWLRFSFVRQLDWQRRYNSKPVELAGAQNNLTLRLADIYDQNRDMRELVRLMFATLGKGGGNGQRIRDDILHIMHRHGISERQGHFMEEWHQKLHNNTTPDDVVICEAFLEFLQHNGNRDIFYQHCEKNGVTKERLASYERPIRCQPDFWPEKKDGLVRDFNDYLRILKSVHSGTDLDTVAAGARHALDPGMNQALTGILSGRGSVDAATQIGRVTDLRRRLKVQIEKSSGHALRDLIFLDIALEEFLRLIVEGTKMTSEDIGVQLGVMCPILENVAMTLDLPEFWDCFHELTRLRKSPLNSLDSLLHCKAITDRIKRILGGILDRYQTMFQPKAEYLGDGFHAAPYSIKLFTEELIRGSCMFTLSQMLGRFDPILRKKADLGCWQIISPGKAGGVLDVVDLLITVQDNKYDPATILIANKITGEEEVPDGVVAVLTPDQPDILSHCAVRARNQHVLFATCYSPELLADLVRKYKGKQITLEDCGGSISWREGLHSTNAGSADAMAIGKMRARISAPVFSSWCIPSTAFDRTVVGGKSNNLNGLRGRVPDWIHLPVSSALPFGVCERVLEDKVNADLYEQYKALVPTIDSNRAEALQKLKDIICSLRAPAELTAAMETVLKNHGPKLDGVCTWDEAWSSIRRVWASKWNDRAYISTKKAGIEQSEVTMAVLIQEVVPAQYAYVIHTTNPFTKDPNEIYAEVVVGLGETLVGNYPGRAFSFTCSKSNLKEPKILAFPSKSAALLGGGLIFRSDSNGEDLEGYAGAGLYDSILAKPAKEVGVEYQDEKLVWDSKFRKDLACGIVSIGSIIENTLESAQDIEGCYVDGKFFVVQTRPQV